MNVSRRALLHWGGGAIATAVTSALTVPALAAPAIVGLRDLGVRTLSLDCYHTGEQLNNVTYWADGKYVPDALTQINRALRDYRTDQVYPIEPKVLDILTQIGRRLDTNCRFDLYSGYRSPKTNAMLHQSDPEVATHSLHMKGQAVDIALPGRSLESIHKTALALQMGGVGYYPDADFLHVDVGRVRQWVGLG